MVSHIWYFSWPHDLWPWMTFNGQIKYIWIFYWAVSSEWCMLWPKFTCNTWSFSWPHDRWPWMTSYRLNKRFWEMFKPIQLDPILLLVNFCHELAQIMTTHEFLRWISCKVAQIMTTYEFLRSGEVMLSTVRCISNFAYLEWLTLPIWNGSQLYLPGMAYFDA